MRIYRIGVISDTCVPDILPALPSGIGDVLGQVDLIAHLGDVTGQDTLIELSRLAPVIAVKGDQDNLDLPHSLLVPVCGQTIALVHGRRPAAKEAPAWLDNELRQGKNRWLDGFLRDLHKTFPGTAAVIFGHLRRPYMARHDGVLLFCPGAIFHRTVEITKAELAKHPPVHRRATLERWLAEAEKDPDRVPVPPTVGILTISDGRIEAELVSLPSG
jgi:putative phosphoesterase